MPITITIGFGPRLPTPDALKDLERLMTKTIDELNQLKADVAAAKARSDEDAQNFKASLADLHVKLDELQGQLGEATPEVTALIDDIRTGLVEIDPDPSFPPTPTPEVPPTPTPETPVEPTPENPTP